VLPTPDGEVTEVHATVTADVIDITLVNFQGLVVQAECAWGGRQETFKQALDGLLAELAVLRWIPVAQLEDAHD
jgi:hypothetical protein